MGTIWQNDCMWLIDCSRETGSIFVTLVLYVRPFDVQTLFRLEELGE